MIVVLYTATVFFAQYAAQFDAILNWLQNHYPQARANRRVTFSYHAAV